MKRTILSIVSVLVFAGLMFYNLQQADEQQHFMTSDISIAELSLMPTVALAEGACSSGPYTGCWPDCPFYTMVVGPGVYRCDCGPGICMPEDQDL